MPIPRMLEDLQSLSDEQYAAAMFALLEAVDFDYERFCNVLGYDSKDDATFEWWYMIHTAYADTWKELGTEAFTAFVATAS